MEDLLKEGLKFLVETYREGGLVAILFVIIAGGGMGWIFWAAAKANAKSMEKNEK